MKSEKQKGKRERQRFCYCPCQTTGSLSLPLWRVVSLSLKLLCFLPVLVRIRFSLILFLFRVRVCCLVNSTVVFCFPSFHTKQSFLLLYLHFWRTVVEKGWAKRSRCLHLTFISPIVGFVAAPVRIRFCGDNNKNNRVHFFFCNVFYFSLRSKHHEKACKTERVLALK